MLVYQGFYIGGHIQGYYTRAYVYGICTEGAYKGIVYVVHMDRTVYTYV